MIGQWLRINSKWAINLSTVDDVQIYEPGDNPQFPNGAIVFWRPAEPNGHPPRTDCIPSDFSDFAAISERVRTWIASQVAS